MLEEEEQEDEDVLKMRRKKLYEYLKLHTIILIYRDIAQKGKPEEMKNIIPFKSGIKYSKTILRLRIKC